MTQQKVAEGEEASWAQGKPGYAPEWKKRFYPAWRIWLSTKSPARSWRYRVANPTSRAGTWAWTARASRCPARTTIATSTISWASSACAPARTTADLVLKYSDRKETLVSNLFRETRWDNNHAARGISVNIDHQFQGGRYSLQAGWDRALSNRVSVGESWSLSSPGPATIRRAASARNRSSRTAGPSRPRRPGSGAHRRNHAHPLRRPGMAAGAGRVRTLPAIAFPTAAPTTTRAATSFSKVRYLPGTVDVSYDASARHLSDRIEWERLALDAGVRYDRRASWARTISPRPAWIGDARLGRHAAQRGWSRYYGSEVLQTALEEEINRMRRQVLDAKGRPVADGTGEYYVLYQACACPTTTNGPCRCASAWPASKAR